MTYLDQAPPTPATVCFEHGRHAVDRLYVQVCIVCMREILGRLDEHERQLRKLESRK